MILQLFSTTDRGSQAPNLFSGLAKQNTPAVQEQGQNVDAVAVVVVFPWLNHLSLKKN